MRYERLKQKLARPASFRIPFTGVARMSAAVAPATAPAAGAQSTFSLRASRGMAHSLAREESALMRRGMAIALRLFHEAAERVPAYRDFLRARGVDHRRIRTAADFVHVPVTDKDSYINAYPLDWLCWDGDMQSGAFISSSTGTTGSPSYWPRFAAQDAEATRVHEGVLRDIFASDRFSTLVLICFSMGSHIAGYITATSTQHASWRGYPVSTITPGLDMKAIIRAVKELSGAYGQIVLAGYPPYIKDVIEEGAAQGINWKALRVRFLFAAESFSEAWREYVHDAVGATSYFDTSVNFYGCADAGVMAHETPVSVFVRRALYEDRELAHAMTGSAVNPGLYQYDPCRRYFERAGGELLFTARTGIPLIRYNIHDRGTIFPLSAALGLIDGRGVSTVRAMRAAGLGHHLNALPLVAVAGRSNFSVTIYGLNIYPEHIRAILETPEWLPLLTGKFVLATEYTDKQDQYLMVRIELKNGVAPAEDMQARLTDHLAQGLTALNAEYATLARAIGTRARPTVALLPFQDPAYFPPGVKHAWKK